LVSGASVVGCHGWRWSLSVAVWPPCGPRRVRSQRHRSTARVATQQEMAQLDSACSASGLWNSTVASDHKLLTPMVVGPHRARTRPADLGTTHTPIETARLTTPRRAFRRLPDVDTDRTTVAAITGLDITSRAQFRSVRAASGCGGVCTRAPKPAAIRQDPAPRSRAVRGPAAWVIQPVSTLPIGVVPM